MGSGTGLRLGSQRYYGHGEPTAPFERTFLADAICMPQVIETSDTSRPFSVNGSTFTDFQSAAGRSCDNQKNACADAANSGKANFEVSDCETQDSKSPP